MRIQYHLYISLKSLKNIGNQVPEEASECEEGDRKVPDLILVKLVKIYNEANLSKNYKTKYLKDSVLEREKIVRKVTNSKVCGEE